MPAKDQYLRFLEEWLSPLGEITSRAMFGGHCLYCDGIVFALVASQVVYLKVDDISRGAFEARQLQPFRPFEDRPEVMQYYPPPPEFYDNSDVMLEWGQAAVDAGRRARERKNKPGLKRAGCAGSRPGGRPRETR
jgi:DNA transformation protein